ncbi:4Fe-4S dicluster domain-containing protein [Clostridium sp.]|jgi:ferredoxin like protein|uniref:ferredoxin family protein n=1 Tax=Clostridium sp. TaxID=1506 RepID=UPI002587ACC5|nr:4Fe-4S dicluster domain-containing protein [Clostridium sp.]MDF2503605.1 hypothetical protein [Clostridium sp.]
MEGDEIMDEIKNKVNIDDKLFFNSYNVDTTSHLIIKDPTVCLNCNEKVCTFICPARVYEWEDEHLVVGYEGCLECGACRVGCSHDNIDWRYPRGGFGIQFRLG